MLNAELAAVVTRIAREPDDDSVIQSNPKHFKLSLRSSKVCDLWDQQEADFKYLTIWSGIGPLCKFNKTNKPTYQPSWDS